MPRMTHDRKTTIATPASTDPTRNGRFWPPKTATGAPRGSMTPLSARMRQIGIGRKSLVHIRPLVLRECQPPTHPLHPYPDDLVPVTKVGAERDDQGQWPAAQRLEQLRAGVEANLASLGVEQVPVVNLRHHPDSDEPLTE